MGKLIVWLQKETEMLNIVLPLQKWKIMLELHLVSISIF